MCLLPVLAALATLTFGNGAGIKKIQSYYEENQVDEKQTFYKVFSFHPVRMMIFNTVQSTFENCKTVKHCMINDKHGPAVRLNTFFIFKNHTHYSTSFKCKSNHDIHLKCSR